MLTDQIADLLFTTERDANHNLLREGVDEEKIHFVGNVMIDTLLRHKEQALALDTLETHDLQPQGYALLTLHRPSNVDAPEALAGILDALAEIQSRLSILFPAHPRTVKRIAEFGFDDRLALWNASRSNSESTEEAYSTGLAAMPDLRITPPLGYLDFLNLMANARLVLTDSGGIQEETSILALVLRCRGRTSALPDTAREHGAPGDGDGRDEPDRGERLGAHRARGVGGA